MQASQASGFSKEQAIASESEYTFLLAESAADAKGPAVCEAVACAAAVAVAALLASSPAELDDVDACSLSDVTVTFEIEVAGRERR